MIHEITLIDLFPSLPELSVIDPKFRSFELVLVLVVVLDASAFSAAKRARLSRNYFVLLLSL